MLVYKALAVKPLSTLNPFAKNLSQISTTGKTRLFFYFERMISTAFACFYENSWANILENEQS